MQVGGSVGGTTGGDDGANVGGETGVAGAVVCSFVGVEVVAVVVGFGVETLVGPFVGGAVVSPVGF